jgi:hypothetical protein
MKKLYIFATFALLAVMLFLPARTASAAQGVFDGQVIFGESFTLASGETLTGDLLVFGGTADIQAGATVEGNVVLFGGELIVDGDVIGTVSVTGATVTLGPSAHIGGDLVTVGATLERAETAQVDGQVFNTATSWSDTSNGEPPVLPEITVPEVTVPEITTPVVNFNLHPFQYFWNVIGNAIFLGLLAMLLMLFLARQSERVAQAAITQPVTAGGLGLLTVIAAPFAIVLLSITIILIPAAILAAIALAGALIFGWIALGYETGKRLTNAFHWQWHPAFSAGLGTFLLTLVVNSAQILNFIPGLKCFTWILPTLVGLFALGAVIMTRFGTQSVAATQASPAVAVPPPSPAVEPTAPVESVPPIPPEGPKNSRKSK